MQKMVETSVTIVNKKGLHARASNKFAKLASEFSSQIWVRHDEEEVNGTHIMELMMLVAHKGCEIKIRAEGIDAQEAVSALEKLVKSGFGELASDREEDAAKTDLD